MIEDNFDFNNEQELRTESIVIHDELPKPGLVLVQSTMTPVLPLSQLPKEWDRNISLGFVPTLEISRNLKKEYPLDVELGIIQPYIRSYSREEGSGEYTIANYDPLDMEKVPIHLEKGAYFVTEDFPGIQEDYHGFQHQFFPGKKVFFIVKEQTPETNKSRIRQVKPSRTMVLFLDWLYEDSITEEVHPGAKVSNHWYTS